MDQLMEDLTRFKQPAMAAVGGIAAALVVATLPAVYLEKIIGFTGISEIISAAAPPLGNTAKGLIALTAGVVSASIIYLFINRKGGSDMGVAIRKNLTPDPVPMEDEKSKFGLPKFSLKKLLQKPVKKTNGQKAKVTDLADLPQLREADSHPDAPARRPIFAEEDLGSPLASKIKPFEEQAAAQQGATSPEVSPAPFVADKALQTPEDEVALDLSKNIFGEPKEELASELTPEALVETTQPAEQSVASKEDMSDLSIAQLADRLEAGLARLQQLEIANRTPPPAQSVAPAATDEPAPSTQSVGGINVTTEDAPLSVPPLKQVEQSEEQVQAARQADMDAALKAALGTLEKMTAHR